jgi:bud site selection protein 20
VHANLSNPAKSDALLAPAALDIDAPGLGLFYCIPCDRHFPSEKDRATHQASKLHKRAAKRALEEPHTVEAAERAAGVGVDNRQRGPGAAKKMEVEQETPLQPEPEAASV